MQNRLRINYRNPIPEIKEGSKASINGPKVPLCIGIHTIRLGLQIQDSYLCVVD